MVSGAEITVEVDGIAWKTGDLGQDSNGDLFKVVNVITASGDHTAAFGYAGSPLVVYEPPLPAVRVRVVPVTEDETDE